MRIVLELSSKEMVCIFVLETKIKQINPLILGFVMNLDL